MSGVMWKRSLGDSAFWRRPCVGALALLLADCSASYVTFVGDALFDPPATTVVRDADGAALQIFFFDTAPEPKQAIFFVSGSGCASLRYFLRNYFHGLEGAYRIFALQKTGIGEFDTGKICSESFKTNYTAEILLRRNANALAWVKSKYPGRVAAVIGASEGGAFAASLAADNPDVRRLVVVGSGGMKFRESLRLLAQRRGQQAELEASLAAVAADPANAAREFLGLPHPYWASMLDVDHLPVYARVTQPILLIVGEKDESVPLESVRYLEQRLRERQSVTFEIVPGASHTLQRDGTDLKPALMVRLSRWLDGNGW